MPLDQGNLEKKDEFFKPGPETPPSTEIPQRKLEIAPLPTRDGEIKPSEGQPDKESIAEEQAKPDQKKPEFYVVSKTIEQLGAELTNTIENIPEGGDVDLKQVEGICKKVVDKIIGDSDISPGKLKDEIIRFAEANFKVSNGSRGFVITELMRVADQRINSARY